MRKAAKFVVVGLLILFAGVVIRGQVRLHNTEALKQSNRDDTRRMILESGHWSEREKADQIKLWEYQDKQR